MPVLIMSIDLKFLPNVYTKLLIYNYKNLQEVLKLKAKVGAVGPKDSLDLIKEIAEEYKDQMDLILFIYESVDETTEIVERNKHAVDVWIFSGLTP